MSRLTPNELETVSLYLLAAANACVKYESESNASRELFLLNDHYRELRGRAMSEVERLESDFNK
jgi:hypothetical protein